MGRNLDRGLDKRVNTKRTKDSGNKSPKTNQVKKDTARKLGKALK